MSENFIEIAIRVASDPEFFAARMMMSVDDLDFGLLEKFRHAKLDFNGKRLISIVQPNLVLQWTATRNNSGVDFHGLPELGYCHVVVCKEAQTLIDEEFMPVYPPAEPHVLSMDEFRFDQEFDDYAALFITVGEEALAYRYTECNYSDKRAPANALNNAMEKLKNPEMSDTCEALRRQIRADIAHTLRSEFFLSDEFLIVRNLSDSIDFEVTAGAFCKSVARLVREDLISTYGVKVVTAAVETSKVNLKS